MKKQNEMRLISWKHFQLCKTTLILRRNWRSWGEEWIKLGADEKVEESVKL